MTTATEQSVLSTSRGKAILALLCFAGFLDFVDTTIVNVALPSIREHLSLSVQNLQWVVSGYLLTYGGFLLLGGRAADLFGRRRVLVAGTSLFIHTIRTWVPSSPSNFCRCSRWESFRWRSCGPGSTESMLIVSR